MLQPETKRLLSLAELLGVPSQDKNSVSLIPVELHRIGVQTEEFARPTKVKGRPQSKRFDSSRDQVAKYLGMISPKAQSVDEWKKSALAVRVLTKGTYKYAQIRISEVLGIRNDILSAYYRTWKWPDEAWDLCKAQLRTRGELYTLSANPWLQTHVKRGVTYPCLIAYLQTMNGKSIQRGKLNPETGKNEKLFERVLDLTKENFDLRQDKKERVLSETGSKEDDIQDLKNEISELNRKNAALEATLNRVNPSYKIKSTLINNDQAKLLEFAESYFGSRVTVSNGCIVISPGVEELLDEAIVKLHEPIKNYVIQKRLGKLISY